MSFDVFVQGFDDAPDAVVHAEAAVRHVLGPYLGEAEDGYALITLADGTTDLYGTDLGRGFMVNHASGRLIWDLLFDVARAAEFVVLPVGCGTCVPYEGMLGSLPDHLPQPIVVMRSGADLLEAITGPA